MEGSAKKTHDAFKKWLEYMVKILKWKYPQLLTRYQEVKNDTFNIETIFKKNSPT
jgi:hypothetical protein